MVVRGFDVAALAKKTFHEILDDNVLGLCAETAYNFFFGLFPLFLFAAPIISLFGDREKIFNDLFDRIAPNLPPEALILVRNVLRDVVFTDKAPGLISVGALLALWAGAGMFSSLMSALNVAYEIKESRPWWKQKLTAVAFALFAVVTLLASTSLLVGGQQLADAASRALHLGSFGSGLWAVAQYVVAFALVTFFVWATYVVLPDSRQSKKAAIVGAVFAALLWALVTFLFRLYVANFGSYNKTYGTIGAVIVLLTWMYWTSFAILAGGELNSEIQTGSGAISGPEKALGSDRIPTREGLPHPSA